ncbi:VanZ family protein [Agromyces cerinus]|uniref:VanZ like family protein n=1 Tax=Agromyces cerinus subsp. cerinus TaxID=232089 RepID=A0A1N6F6L3_9MICO|nr:VanZ family protein [Agromyces cerinus]SIN90932.1 VanZ like family protein [Agromyces cerinus subsp. cerinus]
MRSQWALWVLAVYLLLAAVVLMSPLSYGAITQAIATWANEELGLAGVRDGMVEFAANIAFFVPFGLLLSLSTRRFWIGLTAALVLSASVELVQLILPSRVASLRDVLANVLGAAIGCLIALAILHSRTRRRRAAASGTGQSPSATPSG